MRRGGSPRRRGSGGTASFVFACALAACTLPEGPARDADLDAPLDVRADVREGAPRDAPPRDSPVESDPEWAVPPGLHPECVVERAVHPERLPPLAWESCGAGCVRASLGTVWNAVTAFRVGAQTWYELLSDDFGGGTRTDALAPSDGPIVDAWRDLYASDTVCPMFWFRANEGRAAAFISYAADRDAIVMEDLFWTFDPSARVSDVPPDITLTAPMVGNTIHTQEFVISSEILAFRIGYGTIVVSHGGALTEIFPIDGYELGAVGDHLTFLDAGAAHALAQWTPERGTETLYDPADPLQGLRRDGTTLIWARLMDFVGGLATRAELWTAEAVRDPALFSPRLVLDHVEPDGVVGGGLYGWTESATDHTEHHLVDLDTGRHRVLSSAPGTGCQILHLSRDEVGLACAGSGVRWIDRLDPDVHAVEAP